MTAEETFEDWLSTQVLLQKVMEDIPLYSLLEFAFKEGIYHSRMVGVPNDIPQ